MVDVLGLAEIPIPTIVGSGTLPTILLTIAIFVIAIFVAIGGMIIIFQFRVYNKKIIVFENIAGRGFQPVHRDRARVVKVGNLGEELLWLRKKKVYRTAYGQKMGKNTYWFAVGQDGYWYNVVLGDLDAKMGMLDIEPIDRDVRMMHIGVAKNIQERYQKQSFMDKYGQIVISAIFLIVMIVAIWILLDKVADISTGIAGAVETSAQLQKGSEKLISAMSNLQRGGSGLQPAT